MSDDRVHDNTRRQTYENSLQPCMPYFYASTAFYFHPGQLFSFFNAIWTGLYVLLCDTSYVQVSIMNFTHSNQDTPTHTQACAPLISICLPTYIIRPSLDRILSPRYYVLIRCFLEVVFLYCM